MGYYRPRPTVDIACAHCGIIFTSRHKRTRYCGTPCRTLAWLARKESPEALAATPTVETPPTHSQLALSTRNVLTVGAGVLLADTAKAAANAVFDIQPTNAQIWNKLQQLERMLKGLDQKQVHTLRNLTTTAYLVDDAVQGIAAMDLTARQAIIDTQERRRQFLAEQATAETEKKSPPGLPKGPTR